MHAAAILVDDDDLVHEIFMAAAQRSRMFDDGEESSSGTDGATGGFINCRLPRILRLTGLQRNGRGVPKMFGS